MPSKYDNCISIEKALYFDLFDGIEFKWLKEVLDPSIDREEYDFEVEIEDLPCSRLAFCIVKFTFELRMVDYIRWGETHYKTKTFSKTIEYNGSSALAMTLCGMVRDDDTEDEDDTEEEDEEEDEDAIRTGVLITKDMLIAKTVELKNYFEDKIANGTLTTKDKEYMTQFTNMMLELIDKE
jgi:hypothetical protein